MGQGRSSKSGRYRDFYLAVEKAMAKAGLPVADAVRRSAIGGMVMRPKHVRYQDNFGKWHDLPEIETKLNPETGKEEPVMILCEVPIDTRAGMWWLSKTSPEVFGDKLQIDATVLTEEKRAVMESMLERVNRLTFETTAKQLPAPSEVEVMKENDDEN
jgi:hypothetical protein